MTAWWFRLDGDFVEHPKIMDLSDRAFRLHMAGLCHTTRNLTDGVLSERAVKVVCALTAATRRHVVELRDAGLWLTLEHGYEIKDYLDYNPDSEKLKDLRDKRREAGRLGGLRSGESRRSKEANDEANVEANSEANALADASGDALNHSNKDLNQRPSASNEAALVPLGGVSAQTLIAAFVSEARAASVEVPSRTIGHLASEVKKLLDEGLAPETVAAGLRRMVERGRVIPSSLPNFVVEAQLPSRPVADSQRYGRGVTTEQILRMAAAEEQKEAS